MLYEGREEGSSSCWVQLERDGRKCIYSLSPPLIPPDFTSFTCVNTDEVSKLISQSPEFMLHMDPISTSLNLKQCFHILLPTIPNIINMSLSTGIFPDQFKNCSVHPHLHKSNQDKDSIGNYRPCTSCPKMPASYLNSGGHHNSLYGMC